MMPTADPSQPYILPADAPYLKNLAALWAIDAEFAAAVEASSTEGCRIEPSKSGSPTLAITTDDGRIQYLHSKYQPIEEARRLVETAAVDRVVFYVHGLGLGYHLKQLFDKAGSEAIFRVFEPDLRVARAAMETCDLSRVIESGRVEFFYKLEKGELFHRLMPHAAIVSLATESLLHAPSMQIQSAFHQQMQTWLDEFAAYARTSMNTLVLNGRKTAENISRNLGWYAATPDLSRLKDRYKGSPAIIVSAGPSLRKNKHLLHDAAGKAVIIAVQTTLQPLLEMGIEPAFVTSLDYHDISARFFENLPSSLKTELVAEPKAADAIFRLNPGPLTVTGNEFAEDMLREMKLNRGAIRSGATVAHLSYYLAEYLGCDPIIFVGQDLGFSDGLAYLPGTSYEDVWRPELGRYSSIEMKQWEQIVRDRRILRRIPDHQGRPMYTEERLFTYLQQFERDFSATKTTIIDATEGGASKRGARLMTLAEALSDYCREPLSTGAADHPALRWDRLGEVISCVDNRRQEAAQIEQIARETLPLIEEIRDHLDDQPRVNRAIARVDALRARMDAHGATYDLLSQLTQTTELERFRSDRAIAASKLTGVERQSRQVSRDVENVRGIITAAVEFQALMTDTLQRLEQQRARTLARGAA